MLIILGNCVTLFYEAKYVDATDPGTGFQNRYKQSERDVY